MMDGATWTFFKFALFVTGEGEQMFLSRLFRSLEAKGPCNFKVVRKIEQRSPITSTKRRAKIVGTGGGLFRKDESIGSEARRHLCNGFQYVIIIDDLENDRASSAGEVFQRYREILDKMLRPVEKEKNASVHFLVNMLEAYFFADAAAINTVMGTELEDHERDVETIPHPKNLLKKLACGYREIDHGGRILAQLNVEHVLSNPLTCRSLRTLFAWCWKAIGRKVTDDYRLRDGIYFDATRPQIDELPDPALA